MGDQYRVEIFDLWQYLCKTAYEPLIRCRIDFSKHIDEYILRDAVTLSFNAVPLISCCFESTSGPPRWLKKDFTGEDIVFLVEEEKDSERQINRLLSSNIDFASEAQLKIFLIRNDTCDTACIIINHMICDTAGFKEYLYILSSIYNGINNSDHISLPEYNSRGICTLFADMTIKEKVNILSSRYDAYKRSSLRKQKGVSFNSRSTSPLIINTTLSRNDFQQILTYAQINEVTINDIIMTSFARSYCHISGIEHILLPCTMDLRRHASSEKIVIGNLSTNCMCHIQVNKNDNFADTIKQVSSQMNYHKSNRYILKSVMLWYLAARLLPFRFLRKHFTDIVNIPLVSFTNLGIINRELLTFADDNIKSIYLTASIKPSPYLQLTASTYNGTCTLGCNIYGSNADRKWVENLLDKVCAEMKSLDIIAAGM